MTIVCASIRRTLTRGVFGSRAGVHLSGFSDSACGILNLPPAPIANLRGVRSRAEFTWIRCIARGSARLQARNSGVPASGLGFSGEVSFFAGRCLHTDELMTLGLREAQRRREGGGMAEPVLVPDIPDPAIGILLHSRTPLVTMTPA